MVSTVEPLPPHGAGAMGATEQPALAICYSCRTSSQDAVADGLTFVSAPLPVVALLAQVFGEAWSQPLRLPAGETVSAAAAGTGPGLADVLLLLLLLLRYRYFCSTYHCAPRNLLARPCSERAEPRSSSMRAVCCACCWLQAVSRQLLVAVAFIHELGLVSHGPEA